MANLTETFTAIANAIRNKTGDNSKLTPSQMATQINSLNIFIKNKLGLYGNLMLTNACRDLSAASIPNKVAIFAGGKNDSNNTYYNTITAFNNTLVKGSPGRLSTPKSCFAATNIHDYIILAGGSTAANNTQEVNVFNINYTVSTISNLSALNSLYTYGCTLKDRAIIYTGGSNIIDTYDVKLTKGTLNNTSYTRNNPMMAASNDGFMIAGGRGSSNNILSDAEVYNSNFTKYSNVNMSQARYFGTAVGNYAYILVAGGVTDNGYSNIVNVFNGTTFTLERTDNLGMNSAGAASTIVAGTSIVAGGTNSAGASTITHVDTFQNNYTIMPTDVTLSEARQNFAATTIGNYALFGGGYNTRGVTNTIDVFYTI